MNFSQSCKGRWNPWNGAIHYQLSLRRLDKEGNGQKDQTDLYGDGGTRPHLRFVYAENGYVLTSGERSRSASDGGGSHPFFVRVLSTVLEGDAQFLNGHLVLKCRKELQKLMRVQWHDDGRHPSATVLSEQICVISPPSLMMINVVHAGTTMIVQKENSFSVKLHKSSSRGGNHVNTKISRLQAVFGTKLQWVTEEARPIADQLSMADAKSHYDNLDVLMTNYDPDLGLADIRDGVRDEKEDDVQEQSEEDETPPSIDMFVARDVGHGKRNVGEDGVLIAVRDATTGKMIGIHDVARPTSFPTASNHAYGPSRKAHKSASDVDDLETPRRMTTSHSSTLRNQDSTCVYASVLRLLGIVELQTSLAPTRRDLKLCEDDSFVPALTPPPPSPKEDVAKADGIGMYASVWSLLGFDRHPKHRRKSRRGQEGRRRRPSKRATRRLGSNGRRHVFFGEHDNDSSAFANDARPSRVVDNEDAAWGEWTSASTSHSKGT